MNFRARLYRFLFPFAKVYWHIFRPKNQGAGCVIECRGKLLLVRNTYGKSYLWSFPGGGAKRDESPQETAIREIREEVGIDIRNLESLGSFVNKLHGREDSVYVFFARVEDERVMSDPGEIAEAKWFPKEEVKREQLSRVGQEMYALYLLRDQKTA